MYSNNAKNPLMARTPTKKDTAEAARKKAMEEGLKKRDQYKKNK